MTLSDLIYLCAILAVVVGVGLLVGAFLGLMAAVGSACLVLGLALFASARAVAATGEGGTP